MREQLRSQFHRNATYIHSTQLGAVYKAERISDGEIVAVKKISLRSIPEDQYVTLCRPYELSRYLTHPHLLMYHEAYIVPGDACLLEMELCEHGSLVDVLDDLYKRQEYLDESFIWEILAQIADVLFYLHDINKEQGQVLHKAVRVSSIFIAEIGVKLAKIGSTKHATELTVFGTRRKHDMYLPPEATGLKAPTEKWDIWGLGCVAIELCTLGTIYNDFSTMLSRLSFDLRAYSNALAFMVASCLNINENDRPSAIEIKGHIEIRSALRRVHPSSVTKICKQELRDSGIQESNNDELQNDYGAEMNAEDEVGEELEDEFEDEIEGDLEECLEVNNTNVLTNTNYDHNTDTYPSIVHEAVTTPTLNGSNHSHQIDLTLSRGCMYNGLISDDLMDLILDDNACGLSSQIDRLECCLKTALDVAAFESRLNVLHIICETIYSKKICVQISKRKGKRSLAKTPLMCAAEKGDVEKVLQHLNQTMQLFYTQLPPKSEAQGSHSSIGSERYKDEATALMIAASANNVELVKLLLLEIGVQNQNGMSALMFAAMNNSVDAVKYLVAEAGLKTTEGKTALMFAVHYNAPECVEILKDRENHIADKVGNKAVNYIHAPGTKVPLYHRERLTRILEA